MAFQIQPHALSEERVTVTRVIVRESKSVALKRPFYDATAGPFDHGSIRSVALVDERGGEHECPLDSFLIPEVWEQVLLPILFSREWAYPELHDTLYWSIRNAGFRGPAAGQIAVLDIALQNMIAVRQGEPLHRFFGADRDSVEVYASGGSVHLSPRELVEEIMGYLGEGFRTIKIKAGSRGAESVAQALERVRSVRAALGFDFELAIDVNQAWTSEEALRFLDASAEQQIAWLEEPVHSADLRELEAVCRASSVTISCGESEFSSRIFPSLVDLGVGHLQPIPQKISGVQAYRDIQQLAAEAGVRFSSGGNSWVAADFVASGREQDQVEFLAPLMSWKTPYFRRAARIDRGRFHFGEEPGINLLIDWAKIEFEGLLKSVKTWDAE